MKQKLFVFFILCSYLTITAQEEQLYHIFKEQERIEMLDGKNDSIINISNNAFNKQAMFVYYTMADSLKNRILNSENLDEYHKKSLLQGLASTLREVNSRTYELTTFYQKIFTNAFGIVNAIEHNNIGIFMYAEPFYCIKNIHFIKHCAETSEFMGNMGKVYPEEVLKVFSKYRERTWRDSVVVKTAMCAPTIAKKYLVGDNEIRTIMWTYAQQNRHLMAIFEIFNKYGHNSNAMVLIDDIARDSLTIEQADILTYDKRKYIQKMIYLRNKPDTKAIYSIDQELHIKSLVYVREINDLHDEANPLIRFKCAEGLTAGELYTIMVYSEQEIFTSTFNGLYERLMTKMTEEKIDGYKLFETLNFHKFRSFIKLCASFNTLTSFFASVGTENTRTLLLMFTGDLEKSKGDMTNSVDVADSFGSIRDTNIIAIIESNVEEEYRRVEIDSNINGLAIYGLLKTLFVKRNTQDQCWMESVSAQYQLEQIDHIDASRLFDKDSVHRQLHFFYDDKDGEASFKSFIETFKSPFFRIIDKPQIVVIESVKGRKITILANKPQHEYEGQAQLINYLDSSKKEVHLLVHRGHSYYAMNTVDQMKASCKILFLGSCGGYHNLTEVLDRSPNIHIISSKQIGTMFVNNPLIKIIANNLREGKNIEWPQIWNSLELAVKNDKYANAKFQDYIPPHRNLGAIFMQAYRKMIL